jgi:hypothetical protein
MKRLDEKLLRIRAGQYRKSDFILADAKDTDMGSGCTTPAPVRNKDGSVATAPRRLRTYLDQITDIVKQDIVDIMLMSPSNLERMVEEGVFRDSAVQPAIRANEATDCWGGIRGGKYTHLPSRNFRTAKLLRVMHGTTTSEPGAAITGADLGLYSLTFNNDLEADLASLNAFAEFRDEVAEIRFRYFLEVFNPNVPSGLDPADVPKFVNDHILRALAGVMRADRPQFLKIPFNGPRALEELAAYDPSLIVGVMGGGAGTTRDTFELLYQAEKYGARVALFGRKINLAESPLDIVRYMREVADGAISPKEAVKAYHADLEAQGVRPSRPLVEDNVITEAALKQGSSGGSSPRGSDALLAAITDRRECPA